MTAPAMTPGSVPTINSALSELNSRRSCQKRSSPPGTATTLKIRLVGVTAGLGTRSTLSCTGSSSTAPETPAGVVTSAIRKPHAAPAGHCQLIW
jgi:hypothetical protein